MCKLTQNDQNKTIPQMMFITLFSQELLLALTQLVTMMHMFTVAGVQLFSWAEFYVVLRLKKLRCGTKTKKKHQASPKQSKYHGSICTL